jgi:hypothetical protein
MGIGGGQFWSVAPEAAVLFGLNPLTKFSHHPRQTTTTTHHTRYTKSSRSHTPSRSDQLTKHHEYKFAHSASTHDSKMAETPTFKLVLVGDGGTGKVRTSDLAVLRGNCGAIFGQSEKLTLIITDHLRQASLDW